jgi:Tfp pilus assembly protein PilN
VALNNTTGLLIRGAALEWIAVRRTGDRLDAGPVERAELEGAEPGLDLLALAEKDRAAVVRGLAAQCRCAAGDLVLALPSAWVLLRVLDLPAAEPSELAGMIELQVDKFSPFPPESTLMSYEVLVRNETQQKVLVAVASGERVDAVGRLLAEAGLRVRGVDVAVLGWWRVLSDGGHIPKDGMHVLLRRGAGDCDLLVIQDGLPAAMRSLTDLQGMDETEADAEIQRETLFTLSALGWDGGAASLHAAVYHEGAAPRGLAKGLADTLGATVQTVDLGTLASPALGIALRRLAPARGLDLAPAAWHQSERRKGFRRRMIGLSVGVAALWVLAAGGLFGGLQFQRSRVDALNTRLAGLEPEVKAVRAVRDRVLALQQHIDRTYSALECLREVSDLLPPGIELRTSVYRKARNVELQGLAESVALVYDFKKELDDSELFERVEMGRTVKTPDGREMFKITAHLPQTGAGE